MSDIMENNFYIVFVFLLLSNKYRNAAQYDNTLFQFSLFSYLK